MWKITSRRYFSDRNAIRSCEFFIQLASIDLGASKANVSIRVLAAVLLPATFMLSGRPARAASGVGSCDLEDMSPIRLLTKWRKMSRSFEEVTIEEEPQPPKLVTFICNGGCVTTGSPRAREHKQTNKQEVMYQDRVFESFTEYKSLCLCSSHRSSTFSCPVYRKSSRIDDQISCLLAPGGKLTRSVR